jgi:hypothetical protein
MVTRSGLVFIGGGVFPRVRDGTGEDNALVAFALGND